MRRDRPLEPTVPWSASGSWNRSSLRPHAHQSSAPDSAMPYSPACSVDATWGRAGLRRSRNPRPLLASRFSFGTAFRPTASRRARRLRVAEHGRPRHDAHAGRVHRHETSTVGIVSVSGSVTPRKTATLQRGRAHAREPLVGLDHCRSRAVADDATRDVGASLDATPASVIAKQERILSVEHRLQPAAPVLQLRAELCGTYMLADCRRGAVSRLAEQRGSAPIHLALVAYSVLRPGRARLGRNRFQSRACGLSTFSSLHDSAAGSGDRPTRCAAPGLDGSVPVGSNLVVATRRAAPSISSVRASAANFHSDLHRRRDASRRCRVARVERPRAARFRTLRLRP